MKKTLLAILAGTTLGIAIAAATSGPSAAASRQLNGSRLVRSTRFTLFG